VTIDYRKRDMLTPMPRESMVHVPDGESVVPAVREALQMFHSQPDLGAETEAHLEEYLRCGTYSRTRRPLIERFSAQLQ
jgi:hypothetical protein